MGIHHLLYWTSSLDHLRRNHPKWTCCFDEWTWIDSRTFNSVFENQIQLTKKFQKEKFITIHPLSISMIELEKTYLAKSLPVDLKNCKFKEIIDIYIPKFDRHPSLRLRKNGDKYELTKKELVDKNNASCANEQTIILSKEEFDVLYEQLDGKKTHKIRYYYDYNGIIAEFDVFQDLLKGLVVIDFEFQTVEEKNNFKTPDFCLVEVTQEEFIAGGMVCGKSYEDIEHELAKFQYKKLFFE